VSVDQSYSISVNFKSPLTVFKSAVKDVCILISVLAVSSVTVKRQVIETLSTGFGQGYERLSN